MDATHFRLTNFLLLFKQFRDQRPELPDRGMLKKFSEHLELSERYMSHIKCGRKGIGSVVARQIEQRCGKPHGWLDLPHTESDPKNGEERVMIEQLLLLHRSSPGTVRRLLTESIRDVLSGIDRDDHDDTGKKRA